MIPEIPIKFTRFPDGYINDVNGWSFDYKTISENKGKLLTIDIDFGNNCSLNCPLCFRRNSSLDDQKKELNYDNFVDVVLQAKELGLRSVKFLGAGEPLENYNFLKVLRFLKKEKIIPLVFTKGQVIGNDKLVEKYYGEAGIFSGEELVRELFNCNASILLSINSFDPQIQSRLVGSDLFYIETRNRALQLLVDAKFNDCIPTRLAIINSPLTKLSYPEAFDIYKWARVRNLYCVITTSMVSGRAKGNSWRYMTPSDSDLIELYSKIYRFNIDTNLQSEKQIVFEGISPYAGAHPCNQVAVGLYISLNGKVLSCPGREELVEGNYWEKSLKYIWANSKNFERAGTFNNGCIAKEGKSIPKKFYRKVLNKVVQYEKIS